ncbi:MAG: hypothetical protein AB7V46_07820 [Thermomicrobiales bacterium]
MSQADRQPLFRTRLYPFVEAWPAGPGFTVSVIRFLLPASIPTEPTTLGSAGRLCPAVLAPEIPFSILPFSLREAISSGVLDAGELWRGRPVPPWRGVSCRVGHLALRLTNEIDPESPATFNILVLLPDRDPPGPLVNHVLLGTEFLRHYAFRVLISYAAIRYLDADESGRLGVDPSGACGFLEKF